MSKSLNDEFPPLLKNEQGEFFVFPLLSAQIENQQLHVKEHKNNETLCGQHCNPKTKILKKFPPANFKTKWKACPICLEKTRIMELVPLSEPPKSILDQYPTFNIKFNDWIRHWFSQIRDYYWHELIDLIREHIAKFLPEKTSLFIKPPVRRHHWDIMPMPSTKTLLEFKREFSIKEFKQIKAGYLPKAMEKHWFIYYEGKWLFFHEAWSGECFFQLLLQKVKNRYVVVEAWANQDPKLVTRDDASNLELLTTLLNEWLLGYHNFSDCDSE